MSLNIEIEQKQNLQESRKVNCTSEVIELEEVKQIRNAVQEHLLFIGLDSCNTIRDISLVGVGRGNAIYVDSKSIVRKALLSASEKVILVHNHPSNSTVPSNQDNYITNYTERALRAFHIRLLDHIIVTEKEFCSVNANKREIQNNTIKVLESVFLMEENEKLKEQIECYKSKIEEYKELLNEEEEEFE